MDRVRVVYNDRVVRQFVLAALLWGGVALALGLWLALEAIVPAANLAPALGFGRLRPVHAQLALFGLLGNLVFAGILYSSQRLLGARLPSDRLAAAHCWGWQLTLAAAVVTLALGISQGRALAEPEWPIDLATTALWLAFAAQFVGLVRRRTVARLAIPIWFYLATILAMTVLGVVGNLSIPRGPLASTALLAGATDALVQAWYREAGVGLFLLAPLAGMFYDLGPRHAGRPLHSHRLAILHFWSLIFLVGWAAPGALLDRALPDWAQTLGVAVALLVWIPSIAGAWNGLVTLHGGEPSGRKDPVIGFLTAALGCLAVAALDGALLGGRAVASLAHGTDWPSGHGHLVGLGFAGFMAAALAYSLVPRLYGAPLRSPAAARAHLYLATVGLLLYLAAMWTAGATQGAMLRAEAPAGGLSYSFADTLAALAVPYWGRLVGGGLTLAGFGLMAWNLVATARAGAAVTEAVEVDPSPIARPTLGALLAAPPVVIAVASVALAVLSAVVNALAGIGLLFVAGCLALAGLAALAAGDPGRRPWHAQLEQRGLALALLAAAALFVGGVVELVGLAVAPARAFGAASEPWTALELAGRAVYVAEGCQGCHTQTVRPFLWETARYGDVTSPADSAYDHPTLWGDRRGGPDLAREAGRHPAAWQYQHLVDPRALEPRSNMPGYGHLAAQAIELDQLGDGLRAAARVGVPYSALEIETAAEAARDEATAITDELGRAGIAIAPDRAIVALIAYLERLGRPIALAPSAPASAAVATP